MAGVGECFTILATLVLFFKLFRYLTISFKEIHWPKIQTYFKKAYFHCTSPKWVTMGFTEPGSATLPQPVGRLKSASVLRRVAH